MGQVTLGGERLGSGKKMKVDLHGFERSSHDMSYIWRSTMASGTLVPFLKEVALPGDTFDIHLNCDIKTHPTIGPLFGSYKVQLDVFSVPIRLYHSALHNNRINIGMNMAQIKLPSMAIRSNASTIATPDLDNAQINPSSIMSYLGIRGVGIMVDITPTDPNEWWRNFNAVPFLAYWDIYKNYYANKQEEIGFAIHAGSPGANTVTTIAIDTDPLLETPGTPAHLEVFPGTQIVLTWAATAPDPNWVFLVDNYGTVLSMTEWCIPGSIVSAGFTITGTYNWPRFGSREFNNWQYTAPAGTVIAPRLAQFNLVNIDTMRDAILQEPWNNRFEVQNAFLTPYQWALADYTDANGIVQSSLFNTQEGLGIKCYQSDLFNNWLSTEWIDGTGGINEITAVDTTGDTFNIDALMLQKKVYDMLMRIGVSGGTYQDWIDAVYDHDSFGKPEIPVYAGGLIRELVFQEVVSNNAGDDAQPLGTLAGKGVMGGKHKGGDVVIKINEPSYIMGIISLTPRLDYSQGNKWDCHLQTMDDFHKPNLDQIGFQELITEQMAWWSTYRPTSPAINWEHNSAGKQPAWINYMTNVNEVRGNFAIADNEMFMTLNRRYEPKLRIDGTIEIKDLTTYIDPSKYNNIFADTALDSQNFWVQISVDMTARRKMSAKVMPNL